MRILFFSLLITWSHLGSANAWVKSDYDHYIKVFYNTSSAELNESSTSTTEQTKSNIGLYAESGLGFLPWKSQVSFSLLHKTIDRTIKQTKEGHKSSSFADIRLIQKHAITSKEIFNTGIQFLLAANTGVIIPLTREKFQSGNEDLRASEITTGNTALLSSIDRGKIGYIYGASTTLNYKTYWLNINHSIDALADAKYYAHNYDIALGVGLPFNSWLQLSSAWNKSSSATAETSTGTSSNTESLIKTYSASLGVTFYNGFAIEGGYDYIINSDKNWSAEEVFTVGLSHRSL